MKNNSKGLEKLRDKSHVILNTCSDTGEEVKTRGTTLLGTVPRITGVFTRITDLETPGDRTCR